MAHHEEEKNYPPGYLVIQSSDIDDNVLLLVEHLVKRLSKEGIPLYVSIQSGKPTPPNCPPGGCQ